MNGSFVEGKELHVHTGQRAVHDPLLPVVRWLSGHSRISPKAKSGHSQGSFSVVCAIE
jgi:hypothetical protein